jgi:hypothetical protein
MSNPKLFVSYCWSTPEHEEWVLRLGTELRENGVDVILDKWDLKEGNDANAFMERMVADEEIKKVILVINEKYSEKANQRKGGVGTETQIISAEVYESVDQNKFVAVVASRDSDGNTKLPVFYKSRIYIDLSSDELYGKNFEQLLRWIYDKPLNEKPDLGKRPAFLDEENNISLGTSTAFRRVVEAFRTNRPTASATLVEYFNLFAINLDRFRLPPSNGTNDFDQKVIESIEQLIPARNELVEIFSYIALYDLSSSSASIIHKFFENLISVMEKPKDVSSYHEWDWDNLKFIVQESFLLCTAILLKQERFDILGHLLHQRYYIDEDNSYGRNTMSSFGVFRNHLRSITHRNDRLNLRRLSLHADLLKERCTDSGISFNHLMQADFILYLVEAMFAVQEKRRQQWWPETLVFKAFRGGALEVFLRAESTAYFNRLLPVLGVKQKSDFEPFIAALKSKSVYIPTWEHESISPLELMNFELLCSRA